MAPAGVGSAGLHSFAPIELFEQVVSHRGRTTTACRSTAAGHVVTPVSVAHDDEPTWGFRIEHDGSVLAYSGDTAPTPALEELARDADVFICEATLDRAGRATRAGT